VRDRHQPAAHVAVGAQLRVGTQGGDERLLPAVVGIDRSHHAAQHLQHGAAVVGHDALERT